MSIQKKRTYNSEKGIQCKPETLSKVVKSEKMETVLQRLGYILELMDFPDLSIVVDKELKQRRMHDTLLRPDFHIKEGERINRWKLILNDTLEINE